MICIAEDDDGTADLEWQVSVDRLRVGRGTMIYFPGWVSLESRGTPSHPESINVGRGTTLMDAGFVGVPRSTRGVICIAEDDDGTAEPEWQV